MSLEAHTIGCYFDVSLYADRVTRDGYMSLAAENYQYGRKWLQLAVVRKLGSKGAQSLIFQT